MAKGRKRKLRRRYGNGQPMRKEIVAVDRGTPEMQARRHGITRDQRLSPDYPLSVLLGRGLITEIQHDAGMKFAGSYWALFGKPFGASLDYQKSRGNGSLSVDEELAARAHYEAATLALAELGAVTAIADLAIFLRFTPLIGAVIGGEKRDERHLALISAALEVLAELSVPRPRREDRERAMREVA